MSEAGTELEELQPGRRYECSTCQGQLICTKKGDGGLTCCGQPMTSAAQKPLPSAD